MNIIKSVCPSCLVHSSGKPGSAIRLLATSSSLLLRHFGPMEDAQRDSELGRHQHRNGADWIKLKTLPQSKDLKETLGTIMSGMTRTVR